MRSRGPCKFSGWLTGWLGCVMGGGGFGVLDGLQLPRGVAANLKVLRGILGI